MPNTAESTAVCVICGKELPIALCLLRPPYPVERTGRLQRGRDLPGLL